MKSFFDDLQQEVRKHPEVRGSCNNSPFLFQSGNGSKVELLQKLFDELFLRIGFIGCRESWLEKEDADEDEDADETQSLSSPFWIRSLVLTKVVFRGILFSTNESNIYFEDYSTKKTRRF